MNAYADLADREAIRELLARYCHYADGGDTERLISLFTADAVLEMVGGMTFDGRAALRELFESRAERNKSLRHFTANEVIDLDGDRASVMSYMQELHTAPGGGPHLRLAGRYEDGLVRRDGCWLLRRRRVHLDMLGPRA